MLNTKLLAIFAHPDDAELLVGGTLISATASGHRVAVVDLTRGELGSKGTAEIRAAEAEAAAKTMGLSSRENLGLPDGHLENSDISRVAVVEAIRRHQAEIVITHYHVGHHPDHRVAAELVRDACFLSGLKNYPAEGAPSRPRRLCHALTYREDQVKPSFVVDTSAHFERKLEAMQCFKSQWDNGTTSAGEARPTGQPLWDLVRTHDGRAGSLIRSAYGEPFWMEDAIPVTDILTIG